MYKTRTAEITEEVWERYHDSKNIALRNQILTEYLPIVTINARKMSAAYQSKTDLEDIINQGVIALMECIERYDPTKGVQFDSFASIRVRGSMIDYMRKQDWVPRDIRKKSMDIGNAYTHLQNLLGRQPEDAEVAAHLGISMEELNHILAQSYSFSILSYEELLQDNVSGFQEPVSAIKTPEQTLQKKELQTIMARAIDQLGEKERMIVSLYYYEELKLKEIAVILGLTASRVSQLHSKALIKMKKLMDEYINH